MIMIINNTLYPKSTKKFSIFKILYSVFGCSVTTSYTAAKALAKTKKHMGILAQISHAFSSALDNIPPRRAGWLLTPGGGG